MDAKWPRTSPCSPSIILGVFEVKGRSVAKIRLPPLEIHRENRSVRLSSVSRSHDFSWHFAAPSQSGFAAPPSFALRPFRPWSTSWQEYWLYSLTSTPSIQLAWPSLMRQGRGIGITVNILITDTFYPSPTTNTHRLRRYNRYNDYMYIDYYNHTNRNHWLYDIWW